MSNHDPGTSKARDTALQGALTQIERQFGKGTVMRMGDPGARVAVDAIPTGALSLDVALGIGGVPRGRIIEIFGPESSGKTTLVYHIIAEAQKLGGVCAFVDAEHAMDPLYAQEIGVDIDELLVSQPDYGEQALEIVDMLIRSGAVDVVAVDSVAALTPRAELEGQMGDQTVGAQARMMSQAMRKLAGNLNRAQTLCVFTNQIREKVGVMFGSPETQPGGRALKFYSSQRLDIRRIETLKDGTEAVGNRVRVKVVKNKVAAPFKQAEFDIEFGRGISTSGCLLDYGIEHNIVTKSGSFFSYGDERLGQAAVTPRRSSTSTRDGRRDRGQGLRRARPQPRPRQGDRARGPAAGGRAGRVGRGPVPRQSQSAHVVRHRREAPARPRPRVTYLNRRERTVAEVRAQLERKGVSPELIDPAVRTFAEQGFLDDERFARLFVSDKRELEQWGSERIRRGLLARGIDRELAKRARNRPGRRRGIPSPDEGPPAPRRALELLRRRFPDPPRARDARRDRALGAFAARRVTDGQSWRSMPSALSTPSAERQRGSAEGGRAKETRAHWRRGDECLALAGRLLSLVCARGPHLHPEHVRSRDLARAQARSRWAAPRYCVPGRRRLGGAARASRDSPERTRGRGYAAALPLGSRPRRLRLGGPPDVARANERPPRPRNSRKFQPSVPLQKPRLDS